MTTFDRHIIFRFLAATALLVGLLVVFFVVLDYLEYIDDFLDRGATNQEIFGVYYLNYIPEIVRLTSPLAVFLAAIYVTGRLAQSLQLVALKSSGVSLYRILIPFLSVGIVVTGFMFWFNGWIVPHTNAVVMEFQNEYYKQAPDDGPETNQIHRQNRPGSVLSVGFFDVSGQQGFRISLQDFESADGGPGAKRLTRRLDASEMAWVDSLEIWQMRNVTVRTFRPDGSEDQREYRSLDTTLQVFPGDLARTERDADRLTIPEAREHIDALRRAGADRLGRPLVSYYGKFSYPIANLILIVIGVVIASVRRRGGQAVQFGLGLFIAFVYLALQKLSEPFGYAETVAPLLVAWLPHVLFAGFALVLLSNAQK